MADIYGMLGSEDIESIRRRFQSLRP